jgi:hypothetical protein
MHQESTVCSAGDDNRRELQGELSPPATPIWDWLPLAMTWTGVGP